MAELFFSLATSHVIPLMWDKSPSPLIGCGISRSQISTCLLHHKAPTHRPDSNQQPTAFIRPLCCLLSDPFGRKVALNTPLRRAANSTVACTLCACARCNKQVALVYKIDAGWEVYAHSLYFRSKLNLTVSDKNSCIQNMQWDITKQTLLGVSWTDMTASLVRVLQNMKTGNDGTECAEKQSTHSIPPLQHTANQRIQWLRWLTANLLRLCMLNGSGQRSWTHQTYLFLTSSESPQMLQMSTVVGPVCCCL